MKKFTPAIALFCFLSVNVFSQASDPNAVKLLKSVSQKYGNYKTMTMDITVIVENMETKTKETKTGKVTSKGNMFTYSLGTQQIFCDGKTLWTYLSDVNEVQVNNFEKGSDMVTPNDIFKIAEKDFLVYMGEKVTEGGKSLQIIELTPLNKSLAYSKIKMYINPLDNTVVKGIVFDKNAIHYTISYSNFKSNVELNDTNFRFDASKHPGVEVIDLRE